MSDQAQRDEALDVTRSFIVQAPAGSGKTELLAQRYFKVVINLRRSRKRHGHDVHQ